MKQRDWEFWHVLVERLRSFRSPNVQQAPNRKRNVENAGAR
jgi:hypothetical protein